MAIIAQSFSPHEWMPYIKAETTVGTAIVSTMVPLNVDKPITITENPFIVSDIRSRLGTGAGSGRTVKSADWLAIAKGQLKTVSLSGIADKTSFLMLAENCIGIAEATGSIDIPFNYGVTGVEQGFLMGATPISDNIHTLTFALVNPLTDQVILLPGCFVSNLNYVWDVANEGGRKTFTAELTSRSVLDKDAVDLTAPGTLATTNYSIWDFADGVSRLGIAGDATDDVALSRLSVTINPGLSIRGVGVNGVGETVNRGIPIFDVQIEADVKWDSQTQGLWKQFSAGSTDIQVQFFDGATIGAAASALGIEALQCRMNADANRIDSDGETYSTIPLTCTGTTSGDIAQIAV